MGPQCFIDWQLQWLKLRGVTRVVLALGHGGESIRGHLEARQAAGNFQIPKLEFRFDGDTFLGTGGAIKNMQELLDDDFLVTYGDSFLQLDAAELFQTHCRLKLGATMSIYRNKDSGDRSNVSYTNGAISKYDKFKPTPDMEYIDYGMSAFKKSYFLSHAPKQVFDLATVLSQACTEEQLGAVVASEMFYEVGSPAGLERFRELLASSGFDLARLNTRHQTDHQS